MVVSWVLGWDELRGRQVVLVRLILAPAVNADRDQGFEGIPGWATSWEVIKRSITSGVWAGLVRDTHGLHYMYGGAKMTQRLGHA